MEKTLSITFMSGPQDGKTLRFEQPDPGEEHILTIGRRDGCDVYLGYDNQVTSTESVANPSLLSFWLEDSESRNGTFIEKGKEPIKGRVNLRPGSLFRIGRTWMRLDEPFSFNDDD
jgi:pSer/pThr/pTyr-binding forkhead associated (FHA) protein